MTRSNRWPTVIPLAMLLMLGLGAFRQDSQPTRVAPPQPSPEVAALEARLTSLEELVAALHDPVEVQKRPEGGDINRLTARLESFQSRLRGSIISDLRRDLAAAESDSNRDWRDLADRLREIERDLDRIEVSTGETDFHRLIRDLSNDQSRMAQRLDSLERDLRDRGVSNEVRDIERELRSLRSSLDSLSDRVRRLERDP
ncbi:MAG: hypothetical protein ACF8PN_04135 [Phycisphaerales bacterium]